MEACGQRSSLHFYAVDVAGNTYSNGSKKATAVRADRVNDEIRTCKVIHIFRHPPPHS